MLEPNAPTLIKMEGVKKVFLTDEVETHALEEIHLEIKKGTYISIAGPSGCGKSTLLSILGLLDSPSDGIYELNNQPVANLSISERTRIRNREIGFIFQAFNLIGDLTVYENVELPLTYRGTSSQRAEAEGAERARTCGHGSPSAALPFATVGRSTTACRRGARTGRRSADSDGRRADWKPGLEERRGGHGVVARSAPQWRDDLHGYARPAVRELRGAHHSFV